MDMATVKVQTIKLLVDKKENRVLFAEAEKDFVDFLFSLLSMPVGSVVRLLTKKDMVVGCLADLYESVEKLSETYMQQDQIKDSILKPKVTDAYHSVGRLPLMLLTKDQEEEAEAAMEEAASKEKTVRKFYSCGNNHCITDTPGNNHCITDTPGTKCTTYLPNYGRTCNNLMNIEIQFVAAPATETEKKEAPKPGNGGYVKGVVTYTVTDNLVVTPMSTISIITLLNKLKIHDTASLEEKVVDVGVNEALELLKASLRSKTVLTDVFVRTIDCNVN